MNYIIEITEILQRQISFESESPTDSLAQVKKLWNKGKIVLDSHDFIDVDFKLIETDEKL